MDKFSGAQSATRGILLVNMAEVAETIIHSCNVVLVERRADT